MVRVRVFWAAAALALVVPAGGMLLPVAHAEGLADEAARQLELAKANLDGAQYQRAADSAASAFRLDGTLHSALVVQGLAFRQLDRVEEAKALLTTYVTIRGTLPMDERVRPAHRGRTLGGMSVVVGRVVDAVFRVELVEPFNAFTDRGFAGSVEQHWFNFGSQEMIRAAGAETCQPRMLRASEKIEDLRRVVKVADHWMVL